jgi:hypothetical protein
METLGEDLVLLAIRPNGVIGTGAKLQYGLSGSELVRLAALGRVSIQDGRIVVLDHTPTGDLLLDEALASMHDWVHDAQAWVGWDWYELVRRYLERLAAAGTIQLERRKALGLITVAGWTVLDAGRLAAARARLDAIAYNPGDVAAAQAAFAALATVIGLPPLIYPGSGGAAARQQLARAARSIRADAIQAVTGATGDAAVRAATDAAVRASIDATQAAMSAVGTTLQVAHGHDTNRLLVE